jgi:tetratricopeptide (TPR) repeat protein
VREVICREWPDNPDARQEWAHALVELGDLLRHGTGWGEGARPLYEKALMLREELLSEQPGEPKLQRMRSVTLSRLGGLLDELGASQEAKRLLVMDLDLSERIAADCPDDLMAQRDLAIAKIKVAEIELREGNIDCAREIYQQSAQHFRRRAEALPEAIDACEDLASLYQLSLASLPNLTMMERLGFHQLAGELYRNLFARMPQSGEAGSLLLGYLLQMYSFVTEELLDAQMAEHYSDTSRILFSQLAERRLLISPRVMQYYQAATMVVELQERIGRKEHTE